MTAAASPTDLPAPESAFDFDAAVLAPFRMQPGLRLLAPGSRHLTPLPPGCAHQREKLAVLSAFWPQALCSRDGFDPQPALAALSTLAATEHPSVWRDDGPGAAAALRLGTAVTAQGEVQQTAAGSFGIGDEIVRCLSGLPLSWRLAGLMALSFAEDLAIVDASDGTVPWLAVALPSHWAPESKVGGHFTAIHAPVADNAVLLKAADALIRVVSGEQHYERFVWNVSDSPRLHAHPSRCGRRWTQTSVDQAWLRTERQTFVPIPATTAAGGRQAVFTIQVQVQPLSTALRSTAQAAALHAAIASMSPAVLEYRGLQAVRGALLAWLAARS